MNNIIIYTNLLLLIIGSVDQGRHIKNSKRLEGFNEEYINAWNDIVL